MTSATSARPPDKPAEAPSLAARTSRIVRGIVRDAIAHDLPGEAAKMAFYFFLSLFPFILVIFALTGILGGDAAFARITRVAETTVPEYAWQFVRRLITEVSVRPRPGILSVGVALLLWAASNGIATMMGSLNTIYNVEEGRHWWQRRLIATGVLIASVVLILLAAAAFVPGLDVIEGAGLGGVWRLARWPVAFALIIGTIWLALYHLPARDQRHARGEALAGAIAATVLWLIISWGFSLYVANVGSYGRAYGAVGAVIALLLWFYVSAFAVLAGGELGAQLERERSVDRRDVARRPHQAALPGS